MIVPNQKHSDSVAYSFPRDFIFLVLFNSLQGNLTKMPHKKSIPRSLHRARHEIGITFSLHLTPNLSPKKSARMIANQVNTFEKEIENKSEMNQFIETQIVAAAPTAHGQAEEAVEKELAPAISVNISIEEGDENHSDPSAAASSHSERMTGEGVQDVDAATGSAKQAILNLTHQSNEKKFENDKDDEVIISYNLLPAIKSVSSITLMRRIQSHSPPKPFRPISLSSSLQPLTSTKLNGAEKGAGGSGKKRRVAHVSSLPGECIWCGTHKTAQWRKGPIGARSLCNVRI